MGKVLFSIFENVICGLMAVFFSLILGWIIYVVGIAMIVAVSGNENPPLAYHLGAGCFGIFYFLVGLPMFFQMAKDPDGTEARC